MWSNVIRKRRERLGLSQYQAARLLGVDRTTYRTWELGTHMPRKYNQEELIRVLGLQKEVFEDA